MSELIYCTLISSSLFSYRRSIRRYDTRPYRLHDPSDSAINTCPLEVAPNHCQPPGNGGGREQGLRRGWGVGSGRVGLACPFSRSVLLRRRVAGGLPAPHSSQRAPGEERQSGGRTESCARAEAASQLLHSASCGVNPRDSAASVLCPNGCTCQLRAGYTRERQCLPPQTLEKSEIMVMTKLLHDPFGSSIMIRPLKESLLPDK